MYTTANTSMPFRIGCSSVGNVTGIPIAANQTRSQSVRAPEQNLGDWRKLGKFDTPQP